MSVQKLSSVQELSVQDLVNSCAQEGKERLFIKHEMFCTKHVQPVLQNLICFSYLLISKEKG